MYDLVAQYVWMVASYASVAACGFVWGVIIGERNPAMSEREYYFED